MGFLKKLKIELPYYSEKNLLLGIQLEQIIIRKYTLTPMFIAALFMIAKTWKQPNCPSTDAWRCDVCVCCMCNGILFSHKKGNDAI